MIKLTAFVVTFPRQLKPSTLSFMHIAITESDPLLGN